MVGVGNITRGPKHPDWAATKRARWHLIRDVFCDAKMLLKRTELVLRRYWVWSCNGPLSAALVGKTWLPSLGCSLARLPAALARQPPKSAFF
jgi:hypothetical protein